MVGCDPGSLGPQVLGQGLDVLDAERVDDPGLAGEVLGEELIQGRDSVLLALGLRKNLEQWKLKP